MRELNKLPKIFQGAIFFLIFLFFASGFPFKIFAQNECQTRQECEALLKKYEEEISTYETEVGKTQQQKKTLQNQISVLRGKIDKLNLQISQSNVMIKDLGFQVQDTESSIGKTLLKIDDSKQRLSDILRQIHREDQKSLAEVLFSEADLSGFFNDLTALETLNSKNRQLLENIKGLKSDLEEQKTSLEGEKGDLEKVAKIKTLQKQESETTKKDQEKLLKETQGKESEYQKILADARKRASEIKARLFELVGIPKAPTFGEALEVAKYVSNITGVRSALLLAVIEQESALGKNVGQCYLADEATGQGVSVNNGSKKISRVMSPTRDVPYFLNITRETGRDPYKTLVSCPMSFGWGGAMGPAQFIPSTWNLYKDRVIGITGKAADPWDIKDSFLAAGLYLADYGARAQTPNQEWKAAMIYFSGSTNSKYKFYGNSVLSRADRITKDIEVIEQAG